MDEHNKRWHLCTYVKNSRTKGCSRSVNAGTEGSSKDKVQLTSSSRGHCRRSHWKPRSKASLKHCQKKVARGMVLGLQFFSRGQCRRSQRKPRSPASLERWQMSVARGTSLRLPKKARQVQEQLLPSVGQCRHWMRKNRPQRPLQRAAGSRHQGVTVSMRGLGATYPGCQLERWLYRTIANTTKNIPPTPHPNNRRAVTQWSTGCGGISPMNLDSQAMCRAQSPEI